MSATSHVLAQVSQNLATALTHLREVADGQSTLNPDHARRFIIRAAALLDQQQLNAAPAREIVPGGLSPWQIQRVRVHIRGNLQNALPVARLAALARLSSSYFCRAFKTSFGRPPHTYVVEMRIEHAKHLMLRTREPLSQIALACGLSDQAHLSRCFLRSTGESPSAWRRRNETQA